MSFDSLKKYYAKIEKTQEQDMLLVHLNEEEGVYHLKLVNRNYLKSYEYEKYAREISERFSLAIPVFLYNTDDDTICLLAYYYHFATRFNERAQWLNVNDENIDFINCFVRSLNEFVCLLPFEKIRILRYIAVKDSNNKEITFRYARQLSTEYRMKTELDRQHHRWHYDIPEKEYPYDKLDNELIAQITSRFGVPIVTSKLMATNNELRNIITINGNYSHGIVHVRVIPAMITPQGKPTYIPMDKVKVDLEVVSNVQESINKIDGSVWTMFREIGDHISQMAFKDQINRYESYESALL